jgi:hypothetical protein
MFASQKGLCSIELVVILFTELYAATLKHSRETENLRSDLMTVFMTFHIIMAVTMKIIVLWDVILCV